MAKTVIYISSYVVWLTHLRNKMFSRVTQTGSSSRPRKTMRLNKAKCKVSHLDLDNPCYKYNLGDVTVEHSPANKDLGLLMDGKLNTSQ